MKAKFLELLGRHATAGADTVGDLAKKADAVTAELAALLAALDEGAREAAMEMFVEEVADRLGAPAAGGKGPAGELSPELLDGARRTFNEAEFLAGVREVEQTGGLTLEDFIEELERRATPRE